MQHVSGSDAFSKAYVKFKENSNIKNALAEIKNKNIKDKFCSLELFHNSYGHGLSSDASIKNQYVIFTELQRFKSLTTGVLKDVRIFEEYSDALGAIEKAFDLCLLEYEKNSGDTFQNLLNREGVPNGLPKGYCFHDIVRGLQAHEYIPDNDSIPFVVHLSLYCFDMPPEYFKNLSKFKSIERLEIKNFGEFIPSFESISKLHKLRHLIIGHCPISDLAPLARLKSLNHIEFDVCSGLSDISFLAEIKSLKSVLIFESNVSDYSPLLSLENLVAFRATDKAGFSARDKNKSAQAVHQSVQARSDALGIKRASY